MRFSILIPLFMHLSMVGYSTESGQSSDSIVQSIKAAEKGDADAQYHLGLDFEKGAGVEKDVEKALFWLTRAAEQGDADAQYHLGLDYEYGWGVEKDLQKAVFWFTKAAEQGYTDAQCVLMICYREGKGVEEDPEKAAFWGAKAAEVGDEWFEHILGSVMVRGGRRLNEDHLKKAASWATKSAELGSAEAQHYLGLCYTNGDGVEQDYVLAHKWFSIASSLGLESARELRNEIEALMTPDQIAEAQKLARDWIANRKQQGE